MDLMEPREDPGSSKEQNVSTENVLYTALSSYKEKNTGQLKRGQQNGTSSSYPYWATEGQEVTQDT